MIYFIFLCMFISFICMYLSNKSGCREKEYLRYISYGILFIAIFVTLFF